MKRLDWFIARRYLSARRKGRFLSIITWIALGGVTVGVAALVVVIAVMTGMQKDLKAKILGSTAHVMVLQYGSALRMQDWRGVIATVEDDAAVVGARPFVLSQVVLKRAGDEYTQPASLYGIPTDTTGTPPTDMERDILRGIHTLEAPASGLRPILLGSGLADRMQVFTGDTLIVASIESITPSPFGVSIPMRQYEVTGTFTTGMYEYDTQNVYTSMEQAQEMLGLVGEDVVSGVWLRIVDPDDASAVAARLQEKLDREHMSSLYLVQSWIQTNQSLFAALKLEKLGMGLILFLIVVVAAFNIVSTLVMVVADRTREIGILKAMGMTDRGILRVFVMQGAWIGIVGTTLGTLLGVFLCFLLARYEIIKIPPEVYFVDRLPVSLEITDLLVIVAASVVIAFVATIYPSLQAARLQPVEAIRHD
jgi:lipoprotein-releasing system permease protein